MPLWGLSQPPRRPLRYGRARPGVSSCGMIEQAATVVQQSGATVGIGTTGVIVSITLSASAITTALAALVKVSRWIGHTEATQNAQTERLDEIRKDVREIRSAVMKSLNPTSR